jgi:hypothetical protein
VGRKSEVEIHHERSYCTLPLSTIETLPNDLLTSSATASLSLLASHYPRLNKWVLFIPYQVWGGKFALIEKHCRHKTLNFLKRD